MINLWTGIKHYFAQKTMGFNQRDAGCTQSQRDYVLQPRVARRALPWVTISNFSPTPTGLHHSHGAPLIIEKQTGTNIVLMVSTLQSPPNFYRTLPPFPIPIISVISTK